MVFSHCLKTFHSIRNLDLQCLELDEDAYRNIDISDNTHPAMKKTKKTRVHFLVNKGYVYTCVRVNTINSGIDAKISTTTQTNT